MKKFFRDLMSLLAISAVILPAMPSAGAEIARELIEWDGSLPYADRAALCDGTAALYRPRGARYVVAVSAGHGTEGGEKLRTLCHPDGSPKLVSGSTEKGAVYAPASTGGATMLDGTPEHEVDLALAIVVRDELLSRGAAVLMLREDSRSHLDNVARTVLANEHADLHISLHYDATDNDKGMFFASVPEVASYRKMEPVASLWRRHTALGEAIIDAARARGVKVFRDGKMQMDLTLTSYATVPTVTLEVGDRASDRSPQTLSAIANAIADAVERAIEP